MIFDFANSIRTFALLHVDPEAALSALQTCERRFYMQNWILNHKGQAYWKLGDLNKALAAFENIIERNIDWIPDNLALAHYYLETGNPLDALSLVKRAQFRKPRLAITLLTQAVIYLHLDQGEEAKFFLRKARSEDQGITDIDDLRFDYFWRDRAIGSLSELLQKV